MQWIGCSSELKLLQLWLYPFRGLDQKQMACLVEAYLALLLMYAFLERLLQCLSTGVMVLFVISYLYLGAMFKHWCHGSI